MAIAYLALGTNLGDKRSNLKLALHEVGVHIGTILKVSALYRTEPLNPTNITDQPEYLNCVAECSTNLSPEILLKEIQKIEEIIGLDRAKKIHWGPRIIDIDILTYDQIVLNIPNLTIPHPSMNERDFVLIPLKEIAPNFIHPQTGDPIEALVKNLEGLGMLSHIIETE